MIETHIYAKAIYSIDVIYYAFSKKYLCKFFILSEYDVVQIITKLLENIFFSRINYYTQIFLTII